MSKTVSTRLPTKTHEELLERCNKQGCTMSEFVENAIYFALHQTSDFDFGEPEEAKNEPKSDIRSQLEKIISEESKPKVTLID